MTNNGSSARNILLVYEQPGESTTILLLGREDLEVLGVGYPGEALASIHGTYGNTVNLTPRQEEIHGKVYAAIFGKWNEERDDTDTAAWADRILLSSGTGEDDILREGNPATIEIPRGPMTIILTGFMP